MDRPRSKLGPIVRGILAVVAALIATFLVLVAIRLVIGYISPDTGEGPGNFGHLMSAAFYLILAGPFAAIAYVLGMPLISDSPKYRGADR